MTGTTETVDSCLRRNDRNYDNQEILPTGTAYRNHMEYQKQYLPTYS